MEVLAVGIAAGAAEADDVALLHVLTFSHIDAAEVAVDRLAAARVLDLDVVAEAAAGVATGDNDVAIAGRLDGRISALRSRAMSMPVVAGAEEVEVIAPCAGQT